MSICCLCAAPMASPSRPRVQEVNGKLCCGNTILQYFRLVFVKDGKEFVDVISENETAMDEALALIAANAPSVKIGFERKEG